MAELRRLWDALAAELAAGGVLLCPPQACVLHDELERRAKAGDEGAVADLLAAVPRDLPSAIVRRHRDAAIRKMGADLRAAMPGMTESRAATILAAGGARVARGRSLNEGKPFGALSVGEREQLAAAVKIVQAWLPPGKWPRRTQIITVLLTGN